MLQTMRNLAQSWVFKGLMMILVVSFGIWGIGDIFRGNPLQRTVAQAGDRAITVADLNRGFQQQLNYLHKVMGPDVTPEMAKQFGLLSTALDTEIEKALVRQELEKLGIEASEKSLFRAVSTNPRFQDQNGKFDKNIFFEFLRSSDLSEKDFTAELAKGQLLGAFRANSVAPKLIIDNIYNARGMKRMLEIVTVTNTAMGDLTPPDETAMHGFYDKNPKFFTAPEYRSLTIAELATDDIAKDITVTDDQLQKAYDTDTTLGMPEQRDFLQALVQDEAKAKELATKAKSSGDLANAAKSMGVNTVPLKGVGEKTLFPELAGPAFALSLGDISDPVHTTLGWHIVQLDKIIPAKKPTFEEAKEKLRDAVRRDQAIEEVTRRVNQLDDDLAGGHSLEEASNELKLQLIKVAAVDAAGIGPDDKGLEIPDRKNTLKAAFGQNAGETSPIMDDKKGNYIVVRTDDVTPSAVKPYDKVHDQIVKAWTADAQAQKAAAEADKISTALKSGKTAASFAGQKGVDVHSAKPISQLDDKDPSLPQDLLPQLYRMKKGDVLTSTQKDHVLVIQLADVAPADQANADKIKPELSKSFVDSLPDELNEQYYSYLRTVIPVTIDRDVFQTMSEQQGGG